MIPKASNMCIDCSCSVAAVHLTVDYYGRCAERMKGKPLYDCVTLHSFLFSNAVLEVTARNSTELCHMFGSGPDLKMIV